MKLYKTNKNIISVKNNAGHFLNGLTSNEMSKPRNAFLNFHGRIIATFDQVQISEEEYWLAIEESFVDAVMQHLDRYAKLSGVKMALLERNVYFDLENSYSVAVDEVVIPQTFGRLIITLKTLDVNVLADEFQLFRLNHKIPLLGVDYRDEMLLNVSTSEYVSFTKGCYLGQEFISKVYNRSKPTWKLVVKYADECSVEEKEKLTSQIVESASNRIKGFVFVKNE